MTCGTPVGGELRGYTELLIEARREAIARMLMQAEQLGANAVVNVRFSTSAITAGAAELYAYGTAVTVEAEHAPHEAPAENVTGVPPVTLPEQG